MHLVTASEMRRFEAQADAQGLSYAEMMRRAGGAVAEAVIERFDAARVVVLSGPGNNGGDGLVAAADLHDAGHEVTVWAWRRELKGDSLVDALRQRGIAVEPLDGEDADLTGLRRSLSEADVVLDALLGTGASRPIEGLLARILDLVRATTADDGPFVVSVDLPTGLDCDSGATDPHIVAADLTVTFGYPKIGQFAFPGADYIGEFVIENVGIPADTPPTVDLVTADEVARLLPSRPSQSHKGTFGRLLIVAGSANYTGAAFLAAAAAYRAGCGLVTVAVPASIHPVIATLVPEATFILLPEDLGVIARPAADLVADRWIDYDAVLIGCGLGAERPTLEFLSDLLCHRSGRGGRATDALGFRGPASPESEQRGLRDDSHLPRRLVVDADGLNLLARLDDGLAKLPAAAVLTPHPGEMARLTGRDVAAVNADRLGVARQAAADWGHVVLLKGAFSVVAAPDGPPSVIPFADSALATAGTGDVLAGAIAGLLAQRLTPFEAACAGAFLHGLAGQQAGDLLGRRATMAGDVLDQLASALTDLEER